MSSKEHEDRLGQSETGWAETQGSEQPGPQSTWARGAPWGRGPRAEAGGAAGAREPGSTTRRRGASEREAGEEPGKLGKLSDRGTEPEKLWAHGMG